MTTSMSQPMSVLTSHRSHDWYTPPFYIDLVKEVLGHIDLDPAADAFPQQWIKAARWWQDDGLTNEWRAGTVFCNPPYGIGEKGSGLGSKQAAWSRKMIREHGMGHFDEGILLVNSTHGYEWYEKLWTTHWCCLARERIRFINTRGVQGAAAKRGQTFVYFGNRPKAFHDVFCKIGRTLGPLQG